MRSTTIYRTRRFRLFKGLLIALYSLGGSYYVDFVVFFGNLLFLENLIKNFNIKRYIIYRRDESIV